jgi:predicted anti-sigma-YlaC factor YlaD
MIDKNSHLSDRELLLVADGESPAMRARQIRRHLAECSSCRMRFEQIRITATEFAEAHRAALDSELPPVAGSRALLKTRLSEAAAERSSMNLWRRLLQIVPAPRTLAYAFLALFVVVATSRIPLRSSQGASPEPEFIPYGNGILPSRTLTPGATRPVAIGDICSMAHEEVVRAVPNSVSQAVFREYGIAHARVEDYEIDYLIAPGLGGTDDIHNLWPQPYDAATWNARVKDALEERLHQLVCQGKLDLPTAQRDISTDWIAAYRKYFHANEPPAAPSRVTASAEAAVPTEVSRRERARRSPAA